MSRHYGDPTTDAPAPPPSPVVKHASQYFFEARKAVEEMYGPVDINNSLYGVSMEVMLRFAREVGAIDTYHVAFIKKKLTIYGVEVIYDAGITGGNCVLLSGDNEYHFEIPEAPKKRKSPRPLQPPGNTSSPPRPKCPPGEWQYTKLLKQRQPSKLWRFVLSVIDWLNGLVGAGGSKSKRKYKHDEIEITVLEERMQRCRAMEIGVIGKALDCSDCYSKCEEWYNVAEKPKAKTNGEQMATLGELFEGYEEDGIPRAYQSSHKGWFNPDCPCGLLECVCHLAQETK